jgi:hypothetical protein
MGDAGASVLIVVVNALILAAVVMGRLAMRRRRASGGPVHRRFKAFVRAVARKLDGEDPLALSYRGKSPGGRRVSVTFSNDAPDRAHVRLGVSTAREVPSLAVSVEGALESLWKSMGKHDEVTGDAWFDARFFIESKPGEGKKVLDDEVRAAVSRVFGRYGALRLTLEHGELAVELPLRSVRPMQWRDVLRLLERAAAHVECKPLRVSVLEGERNALCDASGAVRCAYCREGVTGDEPDLVACDRCRTVVHDPCWEEHGACPVLGCEGRSRERGRARA